MKHTNLGDEIFTAKKPKKINWVAVWTGILPLVAVWLIFNVVALTEFANIAHAQVEVSVSIPCNNANWQYPNSPCQAKPLSFNTQTWGFDGYLENGKYWKQTRYTADIMIFRMENVCQVVTGYQPFD